MAQGWAIGEDGGADVGTQDSTHGAAAGRRLALWSGREQRRQGTRRQRPHGTQRRRRRTPPPAAASASATGRDGARDEGGGWWRRRLEAELGMRRGYGSEVGFASTTEEARRQWKSVAAEEARRGGGGDGVDFFIDNGPIDHYDDLANRIHDPNGSPMPLPLSRSISDGFPVL
uniref:Uncharacterized protein n=1 Tax=Oryza rufipogon TaxID=4529 RepID=A0A0E0MWL0_ORYRU